MHEELQKALELMRANDYTAVLTFGEITYHSDERSVRPLLDWLYSGNKFAGYRMCDKVVGRAAAFLMILLGVREIYADVISEGAIKLLEENNVTVNYGKAVPQILNDEKTGSHPLEDAVEGITDANDSIMAIELTIKRMERMSVKKP